MLPKTSDDIHFNSFVRRQTKASPFSHWTLNDEELIHRIKDAVAKGDVTKGYRDGVVLAHVEVHERDFYTGVVELRDGDLLVGEYVARREGEEPRKSLHMMNGCGKIEATHVDIILYAHDVLAADGDAEHLDGWEIISVNARDTKGEQPIHPEVLMHNHFGSGGGTDTGMSAEEFEAQMRESFEYWKTRATLSSQELFRKMIRYCAPTAS